MLIYMRRFVVLVLVVVTASAAACDPRKLPGFKEEAKRQEERITRETEEAIKKSPALQELARLCATEIPRPQGFVEKRKYRDYNEEKFVGYAYNAKIDYSSVKSFYLDYFTQHGWQITKQKDGGWGPSELEFSNGKYQVKIYDKGQPDGAYDIVCAKL